MQAGHLHPACQLQGPGSDRLRLPCFISKPGQTILPVFGAFTGVHLIAAAPEQRFYAVGGERVWEVLKD